MRVLPPAIYVESVIWADMLQSRKIIRRAICKIRLIGH